MNGKDGGNRSRLLLLLLLPGLAMLTSCQKPEPVGLVLVGEEQERTFELGEEFDHLTVDLPCELRLESGRAHGLTVFSTPNLLETLEVEVSGGRLSIKSDQKLFNPNLKDLVVTVTAPQFRAIELAGAVRLEHEGVLTTERLTLQITGKSLGSVIPVDIVEELRILYPGQGEIGFTGTVPRLVIEASDSGDVYAGTLQVEEAEVTLSGNADVQVHVSGRLQADLTGTGKLSYRGEPELETQVAETARLERLGNYRPGR